MYDVQQLRTLAEIARTGSYTETAENLGYTQPTISYHMRMLERAASTPLVVKVGRGTRLTQAGRILARHADVVLAALRTAQDELDTITVSGAGRVHLSAMQSGCVSVIPAALGVLHHTNPDLEIVVTQSDCQVSQELLLAGKIDLALICDLDQDPAADEAVRLDSRLLRLPLLTDRRCLVLPADHPAAASAEVSLADFAEERWVLETQRTRFLIACRIAGFSPKVAATSDDQLTILSLAASRIGLAVVNELGLAAHLDPRLVARPLREWPRRRIFALLWPDMIRVPQVKALVDALYASAVDVAGGTPGE